MHSLIHLGLALLGVLLAIYTLPLLLELLVLSIAALLPPRNTLVAASARPLQLAVIIPAHNEEKLIAACVRSVLETSSAAVTVYVIAHNCTDRTAEFAQNAGAQALVKNDDIGGKGVALDFGFAEAARRGAEALLVVDADSVVDANLTEAVSQRFAAGAQALQCRYEVANTSSSVRTRLMALAFLGMNVLRPRGRDRLGLSSGIFGNGFALSADTLALVPYTANSLVEDLEYHLHLIRAGRRVEFVDQAAVYGEMPDGAAASQTQRARWEGGRLLMRRTWRGPLLREVLRGHLRMLEPLLELSVLPLAQQAVVLLVALALGWGAHLFWLRTYALLGLASMILYVLASASLGPRPAESLRALAAAPGYILWKLWMIPRTRLASRRDSAWVRTKRNAEK